MKDILSLNCVNAEEDDLLLWCVDRAVRIKSEEECDDNAVRNKSDKCVRAVPNECDSEEEFVEKTVYNKSEKEWLELVTCI